MFPSIVICTYNRCHLLPVLLGTLQEQLQGIDGEILLVDNGSSDGTAEVVEEIASTPLQTTIRYFLETRQGLSYARNRGVEEAKGDIVLFLDDDALPCDSWLHEHIRVFELDQRIGAVGGKIDVCFDKQTRRPWWLTRSYFRELGAYNLKLENLTDYGGGYDTPAGGNMSFRKSALAEVGPFDPELGREANSFLAGEEFDLSWKLLDYGWRTIYNPKASAKHLVLPERLKVSFFRQRFKANVLTGRLLAQRGYATLSLRKNMRRAFGSLLRDAGRCIWASGAGDKLYYALRVEAHLFSVILLLKHSTVQGDFGSQQ